METAELTEEQIRAEEEKAVWEGIEPEGTPEQSAEPEPEQETPPDPWADVPEAVKNTLQGITGKLQGLDQINMRLKQTESRLGSLSNEYYNAKKAATEVKEAPSDKEMAAAAKTSGAWDILKDEYPEWADAIEAGVKSQTAGVQKQTATMERTIQELQGKIDQMSQQGGTEQIVEIQKDMISVRHPDWQEVKESPDFTIWLRSQPPNVQSVAAHSQKATDAIKVLDLYKETKKQTTPNVAQKRQERLASSQDVRGKAPPRAASESDMTEEQYRKKLARELWE